MSLGEFMCSKGPVEGTEQFAPHPTPVTPAKRDLCPCKPLLLLLLVGSPVQGQVWLFLRGKDFAG